MKTSKDEILLNTAKLIVTKGYSSVSMRDIASSCGILASSLFGHFSSKDEIIKNVAIKFFMDMQRPSTKFGDCSKMDLYELICHYSSRVNKAAHALIASIGEDNLEKVKGTLTMHLWEFVLCIGIDYPDLRKEFYEFGREEDRMFETAIRNSMEKGLIKDGIDPVQVSKLFRHIFLGAIYEEGFIGGLTEEKCKNAMLSVYNSIKK